jgi:hypothetical protein
VRLRLLLEPLESLRTRPSTEGTPGPVFCSSCQATKDPHEGPDACACRSDGNSGRLGRLTCPSAAPREDDHGREATTGPERFYRHRQANSRRSSGFGVATGPNASPGAEDNAAPTSNVTGGDGKGRKTPGPTGTPGGRIGPDHSGSARGPPCFPRLNMSCNRQAAREPDQTV